MDLYSEVKNVLFFKQSCYNEIACMGTNIIPHEYSKAVISNLCCLGTPRNIQIHF